MPGLAQAGDFCPNKKCPDYGKLQSKQAKRNITKYGKTKDGKQRQHGRVVGTELRVIYGDQKKC